MNETSEVKEPEFDPADFGFELYIPKRFTGSRTNNDKDYLIATNTKTGTTQLALSMCDDTAEFVTELIGEFVNVHINGKGQLLLAPGRLSKVSRGHNKASKGGRCTIAISGLSGKVFSIHGTFKRLFMTAKPYAHGNAVVFTKSGGSGPLAPPPRDC